MDSNETKLGALSKLGRVNRQAENKVEQPASSLEEKAPVLRGSSDRYVAEPTDTEFLLIIREPRMHPDPCMRDIIGAFESLSVIRVYSSKTLERVKPPIFDSKYLVIFEDTRTLKENLTYIKLDIMLPVLLCETGTQVDAAVAICVAAKLKHKVFVHKYLKEDAYAQIAELAGKEPSVSFCEKLISTVGLNPTRIVSGMAALSGKRYTAENVRKYVDKYVYVTPLDIVKCALGCSNSRRHTQRTYEYLNRNRKWYRRYLKPNVEDEVDQILKVFNKRLSGQLSSDNILQYAEANGISRSTMHFIEELFWSRSYVEVAALREFLRKASVLELALKLSQ